MPRFPVLAVKAWNVQKREDAEPDDRCQSLFRTGIGKNYRLSVHSTAQRLSAVHPCYTRIPIFPDAQQIPNRAGIFPSPGIAMPPAPTGNQTTDTSQSRLASSFQVRLASSFPDPIAHPGHPRPQFSSPTASPSLMHIYSTIAEKVAALAEGLLHVHAIKPENLPEDLGLEQTILTNIL